MWLERTWGKCTAAWDCFVLKNRDSLGHKKKLKLLGCVCSPVRTRNKQREEIGNLKPAGFVAVKRITSDLHPTTKPRSKGTMQGRHQLIAPFSSWSQVFLCRTESVLIKCCLLSKIAF